MINFLQWEWAAMTTVIIGLVLTIRQLITKKVSKTFGIAMLTTFCLIGIIGFHYMGYDLTHPTNTQKYMIYNDETEISTEWFEKEIMSDIPPIIYSKVKRIIITYDVPPRAGASYSEYKNTIRIKPANINNLKHNFVHETSHNYWDTLPIEKQVEWKILYNKTKNWPMFLTYRQTNAEEDFAEETSDIIVHKTITTDQKKLNFIIKNYLEPQGINITITQHPEGWYEVQR